MNCSALIVLLSYTKLLQSHSDQNSFVRMEDKVEVTVQMVDCVDDNYQSLESSVNSSMPMSRGL